MDNYIQIFSHSAFGDIRTSGTPDKPFFCLADVCRVLDIKNARDCKTRLNPSGIITTYVGVVTGKKADGTDAVLIVPMNFINEPNLYRCIFMSRKKEAKVFQHWVTSEVLPSIRKHGAYMTDYIIKRSLADPDYLIELAIYLKKERQRQQLIEQRQIVAERDNNNIKIQ